MKRVCMWSGPRNVSTAMMYSFAQRPDTRVLDEPLYGHYLKSSGARHPGREQVMAAMDTDGDRVMRRLASEPGDRPVVFAKQMAHHWTDLERALLKPFQHFFLIRDPRHALPSLARVLEKVDLEATGLPAQVRLLEDLQSLGQQPFCVDSRDLLKNPADMLEAICRQLGLSFDSGMTRWEPGPRSEDGVWAPWWYESVHRSTGFRPYREPADAVPDPLRALLRRSLPLYSRLRKFAIGN
ncbi:MAG: sulfotransferase family protein [Gammaproteobacteria bacterium]